MKSHEELSTAIRKVLLNEEAEALYSELTKQGHPMFISKRQYAEIAGCSLGTVDNRIKLGYGLPEYKKMGDAKNAKVMFSLISVANFFASKTIQTG